MAVKEDNTKEGKENDEKEKKVPDPKVNYFALV